jgi:hypothetical protein
MTTNNDFDRLFGGKYLKSADLPSEGAVVYTISNISIEKVGPKQDEKAVLYFRGVDRGLVRRSHYTRLRLTLQVTPSWLFALKRAYRRARQHLSRLSQRKIMSWSRSIK